MLLLVVYLQKSLNLKIQNKVKKVLVVATSRKTRGGITSVVKSYEGTELWTKYSCRWIETHKDSNILVKLLFCVKAFFYYMFLLPSYDLVHIHIGEAPSALRKIPFMFLAKTLRKKTIVHFHSFSTDTTINGKFSNLYKYLFRNADRVIVLSNWWKEQVLNKWNDIKVEVLYNPCNNIISSSTNPDVLTKGDNKYILFAGTLSKRKGYADMMYAFKKISTSVPDWKIVFAGNDELGHEGESKALMNMLSLNNQCELRGWISGEEKDKIFKNASIFCLPSYAEGFPMAVLDAWSYGLPVITTPVGGIPDIANNGVNMLLFNPGDIDGLSECMHKMIIDANLRKSISKESVNLAENVFNINTITKSLDNLYQEIFGEE